MLVKDRKRRLGVCGRAGGVGGQPFFLKLGLCLENNPQFPQIVLALETRLGRYGSKQRSKRAAKTDNITT